MKGALGVQWILELERCTPNSIERVPYVKDVLLKSATEANARIVSHNFHQFNPYGVSGVVVLEQSHITIHTWPEHGYAAVDMFFCSDLVNVQNAVEVLRRNFEPEHIEIQRLTRDVDRSRRGMEPQVTEAV
jgi:S-adenosylmethionine decarboxylase